MSTIIPDLKIFGLSRNDHQAKIESCFTCWSCAAECPVNITNRLNPTKLVRMALLGLLDELVESPEIWYCLSCNRCSNICPMTVKPAALIAFLQREAVSRKVVVPETMQRMFQLRKDFQHVRWHVVSDCINGVGITTNDSDWDTLTRVKISSHPDSVIHLGRKSERRSYQKASDDFYGLGTDAKRCYACYGCSNVCPVCFEQQVFSPLSVFRLANLGVPEFALITPSLWLCIQCQSCSRACCEGVKGHLVIRRLRDLAMEKGFVSAASIRQWEDSQKNLYNSFVDRVDAELARSA